MRTALLVLFMLPVMQAANYSAKRVTVDGFEVIQLSDSPHQTQVSVVPALGNNAYDMRVHGKPVLYSPYETLTEFKAKPALLGVPLLAPWANRLDQEGYFANGKHYLLNPGLGNIRYDGNHQPIHGLVAFSSDWQVVQIRSDNEGAEVESRLECWKHPDWMAQFPFAHTIEMIHRLSNGVLEVRTVIQNLSNDPMPVSVAFHPYYQITDAPRDQWHVHVAAKSHYTLSNKLIPTGETQPASLPDSMELAGHSLDDVYGSVADTDEFWVQGKDQKISIRFGPKYKVAVVYAPPGRNFICFEPMSGPTNAFNLQQTGLYHDLQSIPPGQKWQESFWIRPSGY
jgi:aldose 1-epimerase